MSRSFLRSSLQQFGTTIFSEMTRLAIEHGAANLAQGFPDFAAPEWLIEAAADALRAGHNQYAPSTGIASLRQAIARKVEADYGLVYDPDREVTVTVGATEAFHSTTLALMEPGEEAVLFEPFYDAYPVFVTAAGGAYRSVPLEFPGFELDVDRLKAAFTPQTRLVFLNTPMNPTGKVFSEEEIRQVGELARQHDALIVADEVYEHITFDGHRHLPVAAVDDLKERTIMVSSVSKTFSATGWRIGWILAPAAITEAIRSVHQYVTFAAATPLQHAVAAALQTAPRLGYYDALRAEYTERRDFLARVLEEVGLEPSMPAGAYFLMARFSGFADDVAFCRDLTERVKVAAIPPSYFYQDRRGGKDLARFVFCKQMETLQEAAGRLRRGLQTR